LFPLNVFVNKLLNSVFWDKVQFGGGLGVGIGGFCNILLRQVQFIISMNIWQRVWVCSITI
jgi:hypothetical protein